MRARESLRPPDDAAVRAAAPGARAGTAVALALLILLAVTAVAHGALVLALSQVSASRASAAVVGARVLAEGGLRRATAALLEDTLPSVSRGAVAVAQGDGRQGSWRAEVEPLSEELFWLESTARVRLGPEGPPRVESRVAAVLWALSVPATLRSFQAVVEARSGVAAAPGGVDASGVGRPGELDAPLGCADRAPLLDSLFASRAVRADVRLDATVADHLPGLGLVPSDSLLARASRHVGPAVTPVPVLRGGLCDTDAPGSWGSPSDPTGPCGGHRPLVARDGDLMLAGGEGQGVLLVSGSLRLSSGARYEGLVLAGGDVELDAGARLDGLLRSGGTVTVGAGAQIVGRACAALLGLEAAPWLRRPVAVAGAGRIRPL